jgi:hypothetical protein
VSAVRRGFDGVERGVERIAAARRVNTGEDGVQTPLGSDCQGWLRVERSPTGDDRGRGAGRPAGRDCSVPKALGGSIVLRPDQM